MKKNNSPAPERRVVAHSRLTVRTVDRPTLPKIVGHAAVFDTAAMIGGQILEQIRPGAFSRTIRRDDVRALVNHDPNYVLGRNKAGTLRLIEDLRGLAVEIVPPDTSWARDIVTSIRRGDINQMSIGFAAEKEIWGHAADGTITRTLLDVQLFDVSAVTYPAYDQTDLSARALERCLTAYRASGAQELMRLRLELELLD